jgi:Uma2 family endonuclease
MSPTVPATVPALMTAEEFARRHGGDRVELIRGQVRELPMPFPRHGKVCFTLARLIGNHAAEHDAGHVMTNDSFVPTRRAPDTVRGADICFYSYERLPKGPVPEGLLPVPPDLVVEVRSPNDRWVEIFAKVTEYLEAGVRVAVVLDPATATASVYRPDELQQIFDNGDELVIPDVLPGFGVPVRSLFE